jgi:transducin (beta)-like 1
MTPSRLSSECLRYGCSFHYSFLFSGHQDEINQIRANPSGTRLASCSDDTTARVWKVDNIPPSADVIPGLVASDHVLVLEGHKHSVSTIGWCPQPPAGMNELLAT